MKKLLIIPLLFACYMGIGQAVNPASIIGKPIRIGNLLVAQNDFPNQMNWIDAKKASAALDNGWRLPTTKELAILYINRAEIGGFEYNVYWSSKEYDSNHAWFQSFWTGVQSDVNKVNAIFVRAVRSL